MFLFKSVFVILGLFFSLFYSYFGEEPIPLKTSVFWQTGSTTINQHICWTHRWCWLRSNASRTWILHWQMPLMRQRRRWARCDFGITVAVWNLSFFDDRWNEGAASKKIHLHYWVCIFFCVVWSSVIHVERCTSICRMNVFRYQKNTHSINTLLWHCIKGELRTTV